MIFSFYEEASTMIFSFYKEASTCHRGETAPKSFKEFKIYDRKPDADKKHVVKVKTPIVMPK